MHMHSVVYAVCRISVFNKVVRWHREIRRLFVRLSVCLSVTLVYCVVTIIINQLALDCSLTTLVYGRQTWNIYLHLYGALKWGRVVEKLRCHINMHVGNTTTHRYYFQDLERSLILISHDVDCRT